MKPMEWVLQPLTSPEIKIDLVSPYQIKIRMIAFYLKNSFQAVLLLIECLYSKMRAIDSTPITTS